MIDFLLAMGLQWLVEIPFERWQKVTIEGLMKPPARREKTADNESTLLSMQTAKATL